MGPGRSKSDPDPTRGTRRPGSGNVPCPVHTEVWSLGLRASRPAGPGGVRSGRTETTPGEEGHRGVVHTHNGVGVSTERRGPPLPLPNFVSYTTPTPHPTVMGLPRTLSDLLPLALSGPETGADVRGGTSSFTFSAASSPWR